MLSGDGSTALIGGDFDNSNKGAAWAYTQSGGTWGEQQKLTVSGIDPTATQFGARLSLSFDGNTALAGDFNSKTWAFTRSGGTWTEQQQLAAGGPVALLPDGNSAFLGPSVYTRSGGTWTLTQQLTAPADQVGSSGFGSSVAVSADGETALVGGVDDNGDAGAAWTYTNSGGVWSEQQKLAAPSDEADPLGLGVDFGSAGALSSDATTAVVAGRLDSTDTGAVWPFVHADLPGGPQNVSAVAGNAQATVSFSPPGSNGGSAITSYTVTSSPGAIVASGAGSPIVVNGLTNGVSYTFTVTATTGAGQGPASSPSAPVTPAGSSGGGGGGGGGSAFIGITVSPKTQTVASGGTASFTITVTNTGTSYLFAAGVSAPGNCSRTSGDIPDFNAFAPTLSETYNCTVSAVTTSFTNTAIATAQDANATKISATDSGQVTVSTPAAPTPPPPTTPKPPKPPLATLTISSLKPVHLKGKKTRLQLHVKASNPTTLTLLLLNAKGHYSRSLVGPPQGRR